MNTRYLFLALTGLACANCSKSSGPAPAPSDSLSPLFAGISGNYRFTRLNSTGYTTYNNGTHHTDTTTVCDVAATISRVGSSDSVKIVFGGPDVLPDIQGGVQLPLRYTEPGAYVFQISGPATITARFYQPGDSLRFGSSSGSTGGGSGAYYMGRKK